MKPSRLLYSVYMLSFFVLLSFSHTRIEADQGEERNVCFNWAFGALVGGEADRSPVSVERDTVLKAGDRLKMLVELKKKCFIYLIYHSCQNDVYMLFPSDLEQFDTDYQIKRKYYIPNNDRWFVLDENTGRETYYLLASSQRLFELERLLTKYQSPQTSNKSELVKQILTEIRKVKKRNRKLTTTAERPIQIGGNMRNGKKAKSPDIDNIALMISAAKFYSRTFTIDHQ
ncbi:DUF4384 domain-containing protein [Thermodesulfobacteriota bacterium]